MPKKNQKKGKTHSKVKKPNNYKSKNNQKVKTKKYFSKKSKLGFILVILAVILAIIMMLLLIEFRMIKNPIKNPLAQPQLFVIDDKCSLIVGQLMHTINDGDGCEMRCKTDCDVRKMDFYNSEFIKNEKDCNNCECYCK